MKRKTLRKRMSIRWGYFNLFFILALLIFTLSACSWDKQVSFSIQKEIITTYPFSDPDPIPVFARSSIWGAGSRIYPYFVFNGFSFESRSKEWTVVRLKNKYIEVSILPEVGGKVWGARDLTTGHEFIYTNHVLKFREIALRGPWTSGGIEFNFGVIGHIPSAATPVDYHVEKNHDGSVSCTVGNYDWPSRTRWEVTITVFPDRAYFQTKARWTNPRPYRQSYYAWMNAAIKASSDLHFLVPGKYFIGHDYSVPLESWPIDRYGRDVSWYSNNDFGGAKSYFIVGSYENFFGAYYRNSDFGYGHWALYPDMPGKKIWIWDLSRAGEIWVDLLTDSDGQYSEPQVGRLLNQSDHGAFVPYNSDHWQEVWFPYSGVGEMTAATPQVVLSLHMNNLSYELALYALEMIKEKLVIMEGHKEIWKETLKLHPAQKKIISLGRIDEPENLTVYLGKKIIHQTNPKAKSLIRPFNFHRPAGTTAEELFQSGEMLENERDYSGALEKYLACLDKEPHHLRALCRVAELFLRRDETERARSYAQRALEISMYDAEANYTYGIIARKLGIIADARETLGWAARSPAFALPAYLQLAEIALNEKDFCLAEEYARRASNFDGQNPLPYELLSASLRLQGKKLEAQKICQQLLRLDPLDHQARYELYLLEPSIKNLEAFKSSIRNEFPAETFLEMALHYLKLGDRQRTLDLLQLSPENPEILTWEAYLFQFYDYGKSNTYLQKAATASPYLVFPFREESIPVFKWAAEKFPECWKFRYYLGLIYWHKGRFDEARKLFQTLDKADYYPVFVARAYLNPENKESAYSDLKKAISISPEEWRPWHHLINYKLNNGLNQESQKRCLQALEKFPDNMYIQTDTVKAFIANREYQKAAEMLDRMKVLPYEGASEVHSLFIRAHLHLALDSMLQKDWEKALQEIAISREYPERLGTGRPFDPDQRIQDYLEAICYEKLGQKEKARQKYFEIISYSEKFPQGPYGFFMALALEKIGQKARASEFRKKTIPPAEFLAEIKRLSD
ncbi:MAG: DUF5107 domain-containing protein [Candidatus Aminicenantes bacterium]|nr:DUF5107 domain-containing protein [Candidatus Aminicenantes bacterium]